VADARLGNSIGRTRAVVGAGEDRDRAVRDPQPPAHAVDQRKEPLAVALESAGSVTRIWARM
jgi:hypothetical protein